MDKKTVEQLSTLLKPSWRDIDMVEVLRFMEPHMSEVLMDKTGWKSVLIDYDKPYLMRLYKDIATVDGKILRINLHYFFSDTDDPSEKLGVVNPYNNASGVKDGTVNDLNLYHPHPWAAVFKILQGSYDQLVAVAKQTGLTHRPDPDKGVMKFQECGSEYAFNDPHIWHMVVPRTKNPVSTMMLTYIPNDWEQEGPRPPEGTSLRDLTKEELRFMFKHFHGLLEKQKDVGIKKDLNPRQL